MEQLSDHFMGLHTSMLKISVAVADEEWTGKVRFFGDMSSDAVVVASMVAKYGGLEVPALVGLSTRTVQVERGPVSRTTRASSGQCLLSHLNSTSGQRPDD